jgi:hypothetical protein
VSSNALKFSISHLSDFWNDVQIASFWTDTYVTSRSKAEFGFSSNDRICSFLSIQTNDTELSGILWLEYKSKDTSSW